MREKILRQLKSIKIIMTFLVFALTISVSGFKSKAYDKEVIDYIADAIYNTKTSLEDMRGYGVKKDEMLDVFALAVEKNPEVAYTYDFVALGVFSYDASSYDVTRITIKYDFDGATTRSEFLTRYNQVEEKLDEIIAMVDEDWSDLKKILFIHDYLVNSISYDYKNFTAGTLDDAQFSLYGALIENNAVCEGYSKSFMVLMERLGYDCMLVSSSSMSHMWNLIKLNGNWYHMDVTWDDPIMTGADRDIPGYVKHTHFLLSDSKMINERKHNGWNADAPRCTSTTYDNWKYADSSSTFIYMNGEWYFSDPSNENNLVRESALGSIEILTDKGAYSLAKIYNRIYYTDKYKREIYCYDQGNITKIHSLEEGKYISGIAPYGTDLLLSIFDSDYNYTYVRLLLDTSDITYTETVKNLKVTGYSSSSVSLSWKAATDAAGYNVYMYDASAGKYVYKTTTKGLSATVKGLSPAKNYDFRVIAYTVVFGGQKASTNSAQVRGYTAPASLSKVEYVTGNMSEITVKYPKANGATSYMIKVYNQATKKTEQTLYTKLLQYNVTGLKSGTKYTIWVTPYRSVNGKGYFGIRKGVSVATKTANVTVKVASQTSSSITLKWNKVAGATGYNVYKYNAATGKYVKYKTVTTNTCTVTGYYPGNEYKLSVKPFISIVSTLSGTKKTSYFYSNEIKISAATAPATPKQTLSTANGKITVKWSACNGATSYAVFYKRSNSSTWTKLTPTKNKTYTISNLVKGAKYNVIVKAYKYCGTQAAVSGGTVKSIVVK